MSYANSTQLKTAGYTIILLALLAVADLLALSFLVGFGTGVVGRTTPLMGVIAFFGACVLLAPVNYLAVKRILD